MKHKNIIISIIIIVLFSSCSFINENEEKTSPIEHADLILNNAIYKVRLSQDMEIEFTSRNIEFYNKKEKTLIEDVSFKVTDNDKVLIAEGSCKTINVDNDNNNLELIDDVVIDIKNPSLIIKCDKIDWNNKDNLLNTDADVNVVSEYGLFLGTGLSANLNTKYFEFKEIQKGELYEETN
ncbi:MAG: LPS export ABC transporter periplasmic protein LptC [Pleomorphochaeta sp.]